MVKSGQRQSAREVGIVSILSAFAQKEAGLVSHRMPLVWRVWQRYVFGVTAIYECLTVIPLFFGASVLTAGCL